MWVDAGDVVVTRLVCLCVLPNELMRLLVRPTLANIGKLVGSELAMFELLLLVDATDDGTVRSTGAVLLGFQPENEDDVLE